VETTRKTAVSIPVPLADRAERAARQRGIPRSRLYAMALDAFLVDEIESDQELVAEINAILANEVASHTPEAIAEEKALQTWLDRAGGALWDDIEWKE
jgi:hypothetical protein